MSATLIVSNRGQITLPASRSTGDWHRSPFMDRPKQTHGIIIQTVAAFLASRAVDVRT